MADPRQNGIGDGNIQTEELPSAGDTVTDIIDYEGYPQPGNRPRSENRVRLLRLTGERLRKTVHTKQAPCNNASALTEEISSVHPTFPPPRDTTRFRYPIMRWFVVHPAAIRPQRPHARNDLEISTICCA